jgi:hypothetical protein
MQFRDFRLDTELPQRQMSLSELEDQDGGGKLAKEDHCGDLLRNDNTG